MPAMTTVDLSNIQDIEELEPIQRLSADARRAAQLMTPQQARWLVSQYYDWQETRKRSANQRDALLRAGEPSEAIEWLLRRGRALEASVKAMLLEYAEQHVAGQWAMSVTGIGPVISAGLLAHIDIAQAHTAGHVWRFAGLDATREWLGRERATQLVSETLGNKRGIDSDDVIRVAAASGWPVAFIERHGRTDAGSYTRESLAKAVARRPWSHDLKVLAYKIGDCITKFSNAGVSKGSTVPGAYYGRLYKERKAYEIRRNEAGELAGQAAAALQKHRYGSDTAASQAYAKGMLPDAHIHARAQRWVVKLFLSHWHQVAYEAAYGVPPAHPYAVAIMRHGDLIPPPNWPME